MLRNDTAPEGRMTLSLRNNFFKGGIILAALSLSLIMIGGYFTFSAYPEAIGSAALRSRGITQKLIESITVPQAYVPYCTMLAAAAYSLVSIILIYSFFEKTQSPEILFFGFFVISLAFEFARIIIPLKVIYPLPVLYLTTASRLLLFGRYFGLFSLFASSVYAAGLDGQKQQTTFLLSVLAAMVIAFNVPIDSLLWDSTFVLWNGYSSMFVLADAGIVAITIITYIISAYTRLSKSYLFVGLGALLAFAGRNVLLNSDTWLTPIPGLLLLIAGTWFVCARLHREYLWL